MPRYFNTTGPCDPAEHYFLASAVRMPELAPFIERKQYFVMHAPRQTGKTTAMRTFAAELRAASPGAGLRWSALRASKIWSAQSRPGSPPSTTGHAGRCRRSGRRLTRRRF